VITKNLLALLCLTTITSGCSQPDRLASDPTIDPRSTGSVQASLDPVELSPMVLERQTDFDRWEHVIKERSGPTMVYLLYKRLVVHGLNTGQKPGYAVVRWLIMGYREPLPKQVRQELRSIAGRMAQEETLNPNVQYLVGLMAWSALVERPDQINIPSSLENDAYIDVVVSNWTRLAQESPNWIGPFGLTSTELAKRAKQLETNRSIASPKVLQKALAQEALAAVQTLSEKERKWLDALDGFYRELEDKGADKACIKVMHAQDGDSNRAFLGDAITLCALHRGQVDQALDQMDRMLQAEIPGALQHLIHRMKARNPQDTEQRLRLDSIQKKLSALAIRNPEFGRKCGVLSEAPTSL